MKDYVRSLDKMNIILKILLAIPVLDGIFYGIYRIAKGHIIWGIIWIFIGAAVGWIVDILSIAFTGKASWLI